MRYLKLWYSSACASEDYRDLTQHGAIKGPVPTMRTAPLKRRPPHLSQSRTILEPTMQPMYSPYTAHSRSSPGCHLENQYC
ncbi:hypothetical protein TGAM01_v200905 [Trichoderma gamsii]|uniref:Uncharacterized protein n=1 Tax=Trichoderma gamsii TaxID=398673 RepID=A0A2P5A1Q6_9HYPO|nr:hypothetical protein TGAM01_v200905 [Trichoderma gamsii]PON30465.1 hypothetical protein TGAM01_v200905 [Trichoderma gamsii]